MCGHEKSHPLQSSTLSAMHFKYPLQAQRCSLGLLESVTSMWVETEPDLLNTFFFFKRHPSTRFLPCPWASPNVGQLSHLNRACLPLRSFAAAFVNSLSTGRKEGPQHGEAKENPCLCQWTQKSVYSQRYGRVYWITYMNWTIWLEEESGWEGETWLSHVRTMSEW